MVDIPSELARSIRRGECVLWAGSAVGGLAGGEDTDVPETLAKLAKLPWASVFATGNADGLRRALSNGGDAVPLFEGNALDAGTLDNGVGRFVLHTPAERPGWAAAIAVHDVLEETACRRRIVLLGFAADDPDLDGVLDTLAQLHPAERPVALLGGLSDEKSSALSERFGVEVIDAGDELDQAIGALVEAGEGEEEPAPEGPATARADLKRLTAGLPLRVDVAGDASGGADVGAIEAAIDELAGDALHSAGAATLLRAAGALLAHGRTQAAFRCSDAAAGAARDDEEKALAEMAAAWKAFHEGDETKAVARLEAAAKQHGSAALVPDDYVLTEVLVRRGAYVRVRAKRGDDAVELEIVTLPRALSSSQRKSFEEALPKLKALKSEGVAGISGGSARGRRVVVERAPKDGATLAQALEAEGALPLDTALAILDRAVDGLSEAHEAGLVHGCLTADDILATEDGTVVRGLGITAAGVIAPCLAVASEGGIAPELLRGGTPTASSDAYAVAALTLRCLTNAPSPGGASATVLGEDLDARLDAVLARGMHPVADRRSDLTTLRKELRGVLDEPAPESVETAPAEARVGPPEDPNDLEGWTWYLEKKPTSTEARDAIARIEKEARDSQRWDQVAEALAVRADHTQVVAERVAVLRELAGLFEKELSVPGNAFETLRKLLDVVDVEEQIGLVTDLERLAAESGQWGPLADALSQVAARVTDAAPQAELYVKLGQTLSEKLGATERAIAAFEKAAELEPSDDTLSALAALYRKAMRHAELATTLLSLADHQEGEARTETLMSAAAVLQDDLFEIEGAYAALSALLETDPKHAGALELAEGLARQLEDWDGLVDLLGRRAELEADPEASAALHREAAAVASEHLEDDKVAAENLTKLVEADRSDGEAAKKLAELLRGRAEEEPAARAQLIDTLEVLVDLAQTPDEKAALLVESAARLDQEVDGKDRAADCRERLLDILGFDREEAREASLALEKHLRRKEEGAALAQLLARMGESADADEAFRVDAWQKLLTIHKSGEEDTDGVVEVLEHLTAMQPDEKKWRDDLLVRYLDREDFKKAGPLIRAQVFDEEDPKRKAELLLRGGLLREQIGKIDGAIEALEEAVGLDESLHEAWLALRELYTREDQPLKAIEAQVSGARAHPNRAERVKLTFEAAQRFLDDLGQRERGTRLLEELIEFDPDHREATGMLVEHLVSSGDLERAWPFAQTYVMQVRSQLPDDRQANVRALSIAGRCALKVGETERAREYLEKARGFDATNLDVLRLLADLAMEAEDHEAALRNFQSVVLGVGSNMPPDEQSRLYVRMAQARIGLGEKQKAVQTTERALEIDPDNEDAINQLIELAPDVGGAPALVKAKSRLADLLARREEEEEDPEKKAAILDERIETLNSVATLQADELGTPIEAVRTLEAVLEAKPDDPAVMHQILNVFTKSERWRDAANVLERLADAQSAGAIKAKYLYAGALIHRDHLGDNDTAVKWMRRALEQDSKHDKAYKAASDILEGASQWKELARLKRTRLKGLGKDAPDSERITLFGELGEIYEKRLKDPKTAIAAYNQEVRFADKAGMDAQSLREKRTTIMRIAVQLGDDEIDKAIQQGHLLIAQDPMEFEVYHRLVELYLKRGDKDRACSLSRTLVFLKQADEAEQELADGTGGASTIARRKISRELWRKCIYHSMEDGRISDIFAIVWPVVAAREGHSHAHHSVQRANRSDVSLQSPNALARFFAHACQVLDTPVPDFFERPDEPGAFVVDALVGVDDAGQQRVHPSVLAGKLVLREKNEDTLKFLAGRASARVRPEHILGAMLPSALSLRNALYGVVAVAQPDREIPEAHRTEAARFGEHYKKYLPPAKIEQLGALAAKVKDFDAKRWLQGAAFTVTRTGFVLSGSLEASTRSLTQEGDAGLAVPVKDRVRDLVGYSVSDPYLRLRREIGLAR